MDVTKTAQYLCTAVWKTDSQPGPKRDKIFQAAIDLYHVLAISIPTVPDLSSLLIPNFGDMDFSGMDFLVPSISAGGGMDDIAAGDDDLAADDDISEVKEPEKPK